MRVRARREGAKKVEVAKENGGGGDHGGDGEGGDWGPLLPPKKRRSLPGGGHLT